MDSTRQKKIARLLQKELADIFLKKGNELAHGKIVTVTEVRVSPDLSFAKVFVSVFPSSDREAVMAKIEEQSSGIRFELGNRTGSQLRIVPELAFRADDSLDYIDKIDKLLKA